MEIIFEIICYISIDILGEIILELLIGLGIRSSSQALGIEKPVNPVIATLGYILLACASAGISLLLFPTHFIKSPDIRVSSLILSPLIVGFVMGHRRKILFRSHKNPIRMDSFFFGYLFALTFLIIRFFYGQQ